MQKCKKGAGQGFGRAGQGFGAPCWVKSGRPSKNTFSFNYTSVFAPERKSIFNSIAEFHRREYVNIVSRIAVVLASKFW